MRNIQHQSEEVIIIPVPGTWVPCQSVLSPEDANSEYAMQIYNNLKPKKFKQDSDDHCVVPVMPAVPPFVEESVLKDLRNHVETSAPLKGKKSPYSDKSSLAYRSGSRSCLIPCRKIKSDETISPNDWVIATNPKDCLKYVVDFEHGNVLIRAKGCGMWNKSNDIPFPAISLKNISSRHAKEGESVQEIRGVCFENTSCTEMFTTPEIEANLNKVGLLCANHAIGFWIYGELQDDPSPLITKTVSLFETLGDYRLESHIFPGLELLLSKKYDQSFAQRVIDLYTPFYENENHIPSRKNSSMVKRFNMLLTIELREKLLDGSFYVLDDLVFKELSDDAFKKLGIIPTHEVYEKFKDFDKGFLNLIKLYGRLGFEIGRCISVIHRTGYLWGSFTDHEDTEFHCNAHPDNLALLTKEICLSQKKMQIVAPLDFDMSYKKEKAVDWWKTPPIPDQSKAVGCMLAETTMLADIVAGYYATYDVCPQFKPRKPPEGKLYNVLWFLRDCALYEYFQGYQSINSNGCKGNDITVDEIYDLIDEVLNESFHFNS